MRSAKTDQTGRTLILLVLSWGRGSHVFAGLASVLERELDSWWNLYTWHQHFKRTFLNQWASYIDENSCPCCTYITSGINDKIWIADLMFDYPCNIVKCNSQTDRSIIPQCCVFCNFIFQLHVTQFYVKNPLVGPSNLGLISSRFSSRDI